MSIHKYPLKNGVSWKAVVQVSPRKQIARRFRRKADAEDWEREQRVQLGKVEPESLVTGQTMTVKDLAEQWMQTYGQLHLQGSTLERYRGDLRLHILPTFGDVRLVDLKSLPVTCWVLRLRDQDGLGPKTCNGILGLFRKILNDGVRWGFLPVNPLGGVFRLKTQDPGFQFWTKDQAQAFLDHVETAFPLVYPIYVTALNTGMRLGELAGLKWDCINLERRQIAVRRAWCQHENKLKEMTKTKTTRIVPVNAVLASVFVSLRNAEHSQDAGFALPRVDYKNLHRLTATLGRDAGVPPIRFHDLRHSFASMWMMAGGSLFELQHVLGHQSIQMTERYSHLAPGHLAGKTDFLNLAARRSAEVLPLVSARTLTKI